MHFWSLSALWEGRWSREASENLNTPLKAGYSRKFGVRSDGTPSTWNGQVRMVVTAGKFSR